MKVDSLALKASSLMRRLPLAIALMMAIALSGIPAQAHAITRPAVMKRAKHWIHKRVRYSQHAYYRGYRRDCSGFVSMAWRLGKSYTSSTIRHRARRISWRKLKPGDAVRRPGHVEIFGGWKNKHKRRYWALEESTWGKPAMRRVKQFKRGHTALRRRGIREHVRRSKVTAPRVVVPPAPPAADTSVSVIPSATPTVTPGLLGAQL